MTMTRLELSSTIEMVTFDSIELAFKAKRNLILLQRNSNQFQEKKIF